MRAVIGCICSGLVSDGGVHSHYSHMIALANAAHEAGVKEIFVHAFTDGRDTSPTGGAGFLRTCEEELENSGAKIVTVVGRYFAMDRDRRWDRTKKAWDAIVLGRGEVCKSSPAAAVDRQYSLGKTDEFMPPLIFVSRQRAACPRRRLSFVFQFSSRPRAPALASVFAKGFRRLRSRSMAASSFRHAHAV